MRALGDVGSGSNVGVVGVLGSSCGLEQSSSASDVISAETTALLVLGHNWEIGQGGRKDREGKQLETTALI